MMLRFLFLLFAFFSMPFAHAAPTPTLLVWGDSLSAGYGLDQSAAWPSLLAKRLAKEGYRYEVNNASISGETTAGGRARIDEALSRTKPAVVVIELGANDGLRGLSLKAMRDNLEAMILASKKLGAKVMLIGMRVPPNLGPAYTQKFQDSYSELSAAHGTSLLPFMMEGFASKPTMFQADGLHPTAEAQAIILDSVWPVLKPLLRK